MVVDTARHDIASKALLPAIIRNNRTATHSISPPSPLYRARGVGRYHCKQQVSVIFWRIVCATGLVSDLTPHITFQRTQKPGKGSPAKCYWLSVCPRPFADARLRNCAPGTLPSCPLLPERASNILVLLQSPLHKHYRDDKARPCFIPLTLANTD